MRIMKDKRKNRFLILLFLTGLAVCLIPIVQSYRQSRLYEEQKEGLRDMIGTPVEHTEPFAYQDESLPADVSMENEPAESLPAEEAPSVLSKYAALYGSCRMAFHRRHGNRLSGYAERG